ncbi:MAG: exo-alpha-sialidase [Pseudomonadota bacterium]
MSGDLLHIATRKGLFAASRRHSGWSLSLIGFAGDPVTQVLQITGGPLLAALRLGHFGTKLHASDDGGRTWREVAAPAMPADADTDLAVDLIWCLEETGTGFGHLWAGTIPGALFRSSDAGETWAMNRALWQCNERQAWWGGGYDHPGIHSICVDPNDTGHVTLAVSVGGIWQTSDGGGTWRLTANGFVADYLPPAIADDPKQQDPHRLVACQSDPRRLWTQHHCGIWRSDDGGDAWQAVTAEAPSRFGFAVVVHPKDPDTAWFVPAESDVKRIPAAGRFVVLRTHDGGASFDVLDQGLPKAPAYDLVYRHALDIDASGRRLAMGSTTGALWISDNGGDTWELINAHLPPIAALRFAP